MPGNLPPPPEGAHSDFQFPSSMSFENQIIYRLASLEATVANSLRRIDEKIDRFQSDTNTKHTDLALQVNTVETRLEAHRESSMAERDKLRREIEETRVGFQKQLAPIEKWKSESIAKVTVICGAIALAWGILGDTIQRMLGVS